MACEPILYSRLRLLQTRRNSLGSKALRARQYVLLSGEKGRRASGTIMPQKMQCAAKADAAHCVGLCSVLRGLMQRAASVATLRREDHRRQVCFSSHTPSSWRWMLHLEYRKGLREGEWMIPLLRAAPFPVMIALLDGLQHALDDHLGRSLAVGCLGDDQAVLALYHVVGNNESAAHRQAVHKLAVVCPRHVFAVDGP